VKFPVDLYRAHACALALLAPCIPAAAEAADTSAAESSVEEVVVSGYRAQNAQAVQAKQDDDRIAEYLMSDDIGQQPDYNIADSFRRVPGVQTIFDEDEGRYVSIRGLNPSYTLGAFDGATMATAERGNRQLNLEAIPSTAVRGLEVIKSRTPDVDGNAIGGTINLITRSAFDADGTYAVMNAFLGMSDSRDVPGKGFHRSSDDGPSYRTDGTWSTLFGTDHQFGVLLTGSYSRKRRDQERLLPQQVPANTGGVAAPPAGGANLLWSNYPNSVDRYGGTAKLEYRPSETFDSALTATYFMQDDNELRHSQQLQNTAGGSFVRFNDFPIEKPFLAVQAAANWNPSGAHRVHGQVSYSEASFVEPSNELLFNLTGAAPGFDLHLGEDGIAIPTNVDPRVGDPTQYRFTSFRPYKDDSEDSVKEAQLDYCFNAVAGDEGFGWKAGVKLRELVRDNDRTQDFYAPAAGVNLPLSQVQQRTPYTPLYAGFNQLFIDFKAFRDFFLANPQMFVRDEVNTRRQTIGGDWEVQEQVLAGYLLGRHAGPRHTLIFGLRHERTETDADTFRRTTVNGADVFTPQRNSASYSDLLPSVTFAYDLRDGLRLRLAYAEAVGRPNPSQLAGAETVEGNGDISRGNPELKARYGRSYDAALEYYMPERGGIMSLGIFRKDVDDEIYTFIEPQVVDGQTVNVSQPRNAEGARVQGVELNFIRNTLDFLPGPLSNFGFSANATFLDGETVIRGTGVRRELDKLPGQADFLANAALFYETGPFSARLTYAYTGEYKSAVNAANAAADRTEGAFRQFDFQTRYQFSPSIEVVGEVRNLSGERRINFTGPNQNIAADVNEFGRQFWVGTTLSF